MFWVSGWNKGENQDRLYLSLMIKTQPWCPWFTHHSAWIDFKWALVPYSFVHDQDDFWISDILSWKNCNLDKKRASADTQNGHRLRLIVYLWDFKWWHNIDLNSAIYEIVGAERKTYGGILVRRLQSEKTLDFNPYHDTKSSYLSTLERFDL